MLDAHGPPGDEDLLEEERDTTSRLRRPLLGKLALGRCLAVANRCLPQPMHGGENGKSLLMIHPTPSDEFRHSSSILDAHQRLTRMLALLINNFDLKPTSCLARPLGLLFTT